MDVAEPWPRTAERKSSRTGGDRKQILYLFMKVVTGISTSPRLMTPHFGFLKKVSCWQGKVPII